MKKRPHPITPLISFLFLIPIVIFFGIKIFQTIYTTSNTESLNNINTMLITISEKEEEINIINNKKRTSLNQTIIDLKQIKLYSEEIVNNLNGILELTKNKPEDYSYYLSILNKWEIYRNKSSQKLEAALLYNSNQELNNCIKKIKNTSDTLRCKNILNALANLSKYDNGLYNSLTVSTNDFLNKYSSISSSDRIVKLNRIIKIQNLFNNILESEINKV